MITFDYRGIGGSAPPRLPGVAASMADWGRLDLSGALRWVQGQTLALPVLFVGTGARDSTRPRRSRTH